MLTSEEELWKQAMQLIIPAAPALLTFVMVWIIEIILLNKKIIGWGKQYLIQNLKNVKTTKYILINNKDVAKEEEI